MLLHEVRRSKAESALRSICTRPRSHPPLTILAFEFPEAHTDELFYCPESDSFTVNNLSLIQQSSTLYVKSGKRPMFALAAAIKIVLTLSEGVRPPIAS